jgi:hypothetical protein
MRGITFIIIGILVLSIVSARIVRNYGIEKWQVSLCLIGVGIVLYLINIILINYFIKKRMPDLSMTEEFSNGVKTWELTAGLGIVPKWVSVVGFLAFSAWITAIIPWIVALIK